MARQDPPTSAEDTRGSGLERVTPEWNTKLVIASCAIGAVLLAVGLSTDIFTLLDGILSTTFIVSGLAVVFGALGTQATVRYKGMVIAGVAATALIFLFAIDYLRRDSYVIVELITSQKPTTDMEAGDTLIKGTVKKYGDKLQTKFFVLYSYITNSDPRFEIDMHNSDSEESPRSPVCFDKGKLLHWFGRNAKVTWSLNEETLQIFDDNNNLVGSENECPGYQKVKLHWPEIGITAAHAQSVAAINSMIEDLLSDNTDVRRLTRDQLANVGPAAVRPLMDTAIRMVAARNRLAFRMQVGAAVAIDRMIARDPRRMGPAVRAQLTSAHDDALIQWSLNRDQSLLGPTLRILAATADLPTLNKLVRVVSRVNDENILYNTAWVLRQSAQRYRADASTLAGIKALAQSFRTRSPGGKTNNLLNQVEAM